MRVRMPCRSTRTEGIISTEKNRRATSGFFVFIDMIRLDDLHLKGLKIYQQTEGFCFGTDAVLLAWFAAEKKFSDAVDLCSGNGIIPILLSARSRYARIQGVEISGEQASLAEKSFEYNGLTDRLSMIHADLRDVASLKYLPAAAFDLVTANPPYSPDGAGFVSPGSKGAARTELTCTAADIAHAAKYLLKNSGRLCMINRPERLADVICSMRGATIEPKRIMYVAPRPGAKPMMMLVEGIKGGKSGVFTAPTLEITDKNGLYTPLLCEIYGFDKNGEYNEG